MEKTLRTLEQERAAFAWKCVSKIKDCREALQTKYSSYVKKAPVLILTNGLDNALAFYRSKRSNKPDASDEKKAYAFLYNNINEWFQTSIHNKRDVLQWIIDRETSSTDVYHMTREILGFLNWLKRFAEAELKSGDIND